MSDVIYYQTSKPRKHLVITSYLIEPHRRHTQRELFVFGDCVILSIKVTLYKNFLVKIKLTLTLRISVEIARKSNVLKTEATKVLSYP